MSTASLILLYVLSVVAAFVAWYACGTVPSRSLRCVLRSGLIAVLCAPGVLIGHGLGVAPTAFALYVQPSVFTMASIGLVWLLALAMVFAIPALREHRNDWPPSVDEVLLRGYAGKFLLFGIVAMLLMATLANLDSRTETLLGYVGFFAGAGVNFFLCHRAARDKQAQPYLAPVYFAAPVSLSQLFVLGFFWYGSGVLGAMIGLARYRIAAWLALVVMLPLGCYSAWRAYLAANAASHVTIGGGVAGNLMVAAMFLAIAAAGWWLLRRA